MDTIRSALLDYADSAAAFPGAWKDARLAVLSRRYMRWCAGEGLDGRAGFLEMDMSRACVIERMSMPGINHFARASHRLFTSKALLSDGAGQYPSVSQKYVKALQIFIYFVVVLAEQEYPATKAALDECRLQAFRALAATLTIFAEHGLQRSKNKIFLLVNFRNPNHQPLKKS